VHTPPRDKITTPFSLSLSSPLHAQSTTPQNFTPNAANKAQKHTETHTQNSDPQIGLESKQSVLKMADEVSDAPPVGEQRTTRGEQKTQKAKRKERRKN
jgi:hypothetical protein